MATTSFTQKLVSFQRVRLVYARRLDWVSTSLSASRTQRMCTHTHHSEIFACPPGALITGSLTSCGTYLTPAKKQLQNTTPQPSPVPFSNPPYSTERKDHFILHFVIPQYTDRVVRPTRTKACVRISMHFGRRTVDSSRCRLISFFASQKVPTEFRRVRGHQKSFMSSKRSRLSLCTCSH